MPATRRQRVAESVRDLRAYWALGRTLPPKVSPKEAHGRRVIEAEADRRGVNQDYVYKARAFAANYSRADLNELIRQVRDTRPGPKAPVFGRSHLLRLLSIDDKRQRYDLQEKAIAEGWSTSRLDAVLGARYGRRRKGGRSRQMPDDATEAMAQLDVLCEGWRRWGKAMEDEDGQYVRPANLPPKVLRRFDTARKAVARLQSTLQTERTRVPAADADPKVKQPRVRARRRRKPAGRAGGA